MSRRLSESLVQMHFSATPTPTSHAKAISGSAKGAGQIPGVLGPARPQLLALGVHHWAVRPHALGVTAAAEVGDHVAVGVNDSHPVQGHIGIEDPAKEVHAEGHVLAVAAEEPHVADARVHPLGADGLGWLDAVAPRCSASRVFGPSGRLGSPAKGPER